MIESQNKKIVVVTPPAAIVDNAAFTTTVIDTLGFGYLDIYVMLGATDIALAALKVQESEASGSGFADVPGADFSVAPATLPAATDDNKVFAIHIDLRGRKRYFDLVLTAGDGAAGTFAVAWAELSRPSGGYPSTATARGLGAELFVPTL